jgi:hypothetical protein
MEVMLLVMAATELVCLALAIAWRSRSPLWLAGLGGVTLAFVTAVFFVAAADSEGVGAAIGGFVLLWLLVAILLAVLAGTAIAGSWRSRGGLLIAALAVPAPLFVPIVAVGIVQLISGRGPA